MEFTYKAIGTDGKVVSGQSKAESRSEMVKQLKEKGLSLLDLNEVVKDKVEQKPLSKREISFDLGISDKQLMFFTRQLASLLRAGIPILRCLDMLQEQTVSGKLKAVIKQISADMQQGQKLSEAMRKHKPPFNDIYISMVKVGESTGDLSKSLANLATSLENQNKIKQKIKSALSYPIFIIIFSLGLVYGMVTLLLPGFAPVFEDSGLNIPRDYPLTQFLMDLSRFVSHWWFLPMVFGILLFLYLIFRLITRFPQGKLFFDKMFFYFPFIQSLIQMQKFAQMADLLSCLLDSGIVLLEALKLTANSFENKVMSNAINKTAEKVENGEKFSTALIETGVYSQMLIQMAAVGEDTGSLAEMLQRTSEYYQQEQDSALSAIVALIEPVMMICVGLLVFVLVVGIFLPIMGISQAYEQQI